MDMKRVGVIGGGAAGCMAAFAAAQAGVKVTLLEKNDIVGKKMGITGKGRCNLTNACSMEEFIANTPGHGRFLYSAYGQFSNQDLCKLVHQWGLKTKVERGGRVFPLSDSAIEVRKLWYKALLRVGVDIQLNETVRAIEYTKGHFVVETMQCTCTFDACIIATGGMSYPSTGSTGDGYRFARQLGHEVTELRPSLVPFVTRETWPNQLSGLTLKNTEVSLWQGKKQIGNEFGEVLCTHFGVSGPTILRLSSILAHQRKWTYPLILKLNVKPALRVEQLDKRIQRDVEANIRKQVGHALKKLLPQRLLPIVLAQAHIPEDLVVNQLTKEQRSALVEVLQHIPLTITGTRPLTEAIVTAGGVNVKEINPKTMESKIIQHLYFAGEVLDIDAFTGGYNLQAAFSTGYVAGKQAAQEEVG